MDAKRKALEGIVAIPAKKAKNELALRNNFDENVRVFEWTSHPPLENSHFFIYRNFCLYCVVVIAMNEHSLLVVVLSNVILSSLCTFNLHNYCHIGGVAQP